MTIFATEAPKYWAAGLPAIPLMEKAKRPAIGRWQTFADTFPTDDERSVWLQTYPTGNIGLPMGPTANLVAVDIDTNDPKVIAVLDALLPPTPWVRVGAKGMVKIYRYTGERTTRIKDGNGAMICEILSKGTQIVLPPSIHPDTQKPYVANSDLYEVCKAVPALPPGIEDLIRGALQDLGMDVAIGGGNNKVAVFVPAGARDNTMTWHAGLLARAVTRGERSLLEVLGEMEHWVASFVEQVIGDPLTAEKAQKKVVEFLIRDVTGAGGKGLPIGWDEGLSEEDKTRLGLSFTEDDEKWPAQRILDLLAAETMRFEDPNSEGRQNSIRVALSRIVKAEGLITPLDEERILRFIAGQSQNTITIHALKRELVALRRGDIVGESHEDIASEVLKFLGTYGEVRFDAGQFWQWKGANWENLEPASILKVISEEFGNYPAAKKNSDHNGILRTLSNKVSKELVQHKVRGLNFANGFLTEDLTLIDHNPDHGMTYVLPYRYMPEAEGHMPLFAQYMADSWSEDPDYMDKVYALQEAMGATLFSMAPAYQRAILLFGMPGSGKSVLMSIMQSLLPSNSVSAVPPHDWSDKFLPAELFGKVLNVAGELSETRSIPGEIFKQVVVGELISGQFKNQTPFKFRPGCANWFSSNHLPKTKDSSAGFNRRWLILEWNKRVEEGRKVIDLDQIIVDNEREAIVAWAVQGLARLKRNGGYTLPSSHLGLVDQMAFENNSVRYFLQVCPKVIVGKTKTSGLSRSEITSAELHGAYWSFCIGTGIASRVTLQKFQAMMALLKGDFDFEHYLRENSAGSQEVVYRWITLAGQQPLS